MVVYPTGDCTKTVKCLKRANHFICLLRRLDCISSHVSELFEFPGDNALQTGKVSSQF